MDMRVRVACAMLWGFAACLLATCSDEGTGPVDEKPRDYPVYIGNGNTGWFFRYHPLTGKLDSLLPGIRAVRPSSVSADGKTLYVAGNDSVIAVDLGTLDTRTAWPGRVGGVSVSPDNRQIVLNGLELRVLSTSDFSELLHDTVMVLSATYSRDSRTLYGVFGNPDTELPGVYKRKMDPPFQETRKKFPDLNVRSVLPSADESKWFFYSELSTWTSVFSVYSVERDSIIFADTLSPGAGFMTLTPDNKYLFYTNPGTIFQGPVPPYTISVYELATNNVIAEISTVGQYGLDTATTQLPVDRIAVTPDGLWLVGIGFDFSQFLVIDVKTLQVVRREDLGGNHGMGVLTCQSNP